MKRVCVEDFQKRKPQRHEDTKMRYAALSKRHEEVGRAIVHSAFAVHKTLGPGLLEHVYEVCFCHELSKRGFHTQRQVVVPVRYDNVTFDEEFRLDVLVEDLVICELKAVTEMHPVFQAQLMSYMKLTQKRLGFLINFHVPLIKDGIKRIVL